VIHIGYLSFPLAEEYALIICYVCSNVHLWSLRLAEESVIVFITCVCSYVRLRGSEGYKG